jgi:hypothetical protein
MVLGEMPKVVAMKQSMKLNQLPVRITKLVCIGKELGNMFA